MMDRRVCVCLCLEGRGARESILGILAHKEKEGVWENKRFNAKSI
jgi:hypothetical protein